MLLTFKIQTKDINIFPNLNIQVALRARIINVHNKLGYKAVVGILCKNTKKNEKQFLNNKIESICYYCLFKTFI